MNLRTGSCLLLLLNLLLPASSFAKDSNKTVRSTILGFGPTTYSNLNSRGLGTLFTAGYGWNLDPQFDLIAAVDFGISFKHNDVRFLAPQMKGRYLMSEDPESNTTWYAGGGLGAGYATNHVDQSYIKDSIMSFVVSAAFGAKFFRKSASPLFVELEHTMFIEESAHGTPISTSIKVGIFLPSGGKSKR